ncbi:MAG TPA: hypothetical protein VKG45_06970 [Actinomycetes bacterium]|nr:hypothetical protein [Actinomycetes bacterium]
MAALGAIVLAGCGHSRQPVPAAHPATTLDLTLSARPAPATTAGSTDPLDVAEERALRSYRGMWADLVEVGKHPDGASPLLSRYAAGEQLAKNRQQMREYADRGIVLRGNIRSDPHIAWVRLNVRASVEDCVDVSGWVEVDAATGRAVAARRSPPDLFNAILEPAGAGWKVTRLEVVPDRC